MDVKCFSIFVQNKYVVVTVKNTLCKLSIVMNNRIKTGSPPTQWKGCLDHLTIAF